MRFFEIISVSTLFLAILFALVLPKRNVFGYCLSCSLFAIIFHIIFEGIRWQMFFIYIAILLFPILLFTKNVILRKSAWAVTCLFLIISTLLSLFFPVFTFQKPIGKYGIGTATYQFIDKSRNELFGKDRSRNREIILQIWYPTSPNVNQKFTSYVENTPELPNSLSKIFGYPSFIFSHFKYVKTNAVKEAKISSTRNNYPVIIYHSGLFGSRKFNTFQIEQLVSQGYVVAGIDNPGAVAITEFSGGRKIESLPVSEMMSLLHQSLEDLPGIPKLNGVEMKDGIIPYFAQDISFAIDCLQKINTKDSLNILTNVIDTSKVGVLGVSLGGIVVAEAAAKDNRIKACLIMESPMTKYVMKYGLKIPTMIMTRDAETMRIERKKSGGWTEKDIQQHLHTMTNTFERLPADGYFVQIPGMFHIEFLDAPLWLPYGKYFGLTGSIETKEVQNIINTFSINFFDKELENKKSDFLNNPTKTFSNIIYKKNYNQ
jgi:hypothetical protein